MTLTIADIQAAAGRLQGQALRTPLHESRVLNERVEARVLLKLENLQTVGAFKFRGAYNRLCQLDPDARRRGVVAFSSGNHAQGVACAARLLQMPALIVMPSDAPAVKVAGTRSWGAEIRFYDRHTESREDIAAALAETRGAVVVPAFDDWDIMAGQGTCGLEIGEQLQALGLTPDAVLVPCGGGGLLAGVSVALRNRFPGVSMVGVEPTGYDDHARSLSQGSRVGLTEHPPTLCDALQSPMPGTLTWQVNGSGDTRFAQVSDADVQHAISFAFRHLKLVVEPGGVVGLAAALTGRVPVAGQTVVVVLSGGNVDASVFADCLDRFPEP